jgi:beta-ribofuranosylaminobenzene 5'-phosphate synthase
MDSLKVLKGLEKKRSLSTIEKILAFTTGSVTEILEAYLEGPVEVRTIRQEVAKAGDLAKDLDVEKTDDVNFREVEIIDEEDNVQIYARSWTPIKRLAPAFREDLMKADVPIGKLLAKHKIESRRELLDVKLDDEDRIKRTYNIIRNGEILMRIEEKFEKL